LKKGRGNWEGGEGGSLFFFEFLYPLFLTTNEQGKRLALKVVKKENDFNYLPDFFLLLLRV
jgi:hypothetical protein